VDAGLLCNEVAMLGTATKETQFYVEYMRTSLFVVLLIPNPEPVTPISDSGNQFVLSFFSSASRRTK